MIKIIFFADTHLGFDFPLRPKKKKRRRGIDFFNNFDEISFDSKLESTYKFIRLNTRPMVDIVLEKETYTSSTLKKDILLQIKEIPSDSIIKLKMKNNANLSLLNVKLLDDLIPSTMNYQVAEYRDYYSSNPFNLRTEPH